MKRAYKVGDKIEILDNQGQNCLYKNGDIAVIFEVDEDGGVGARFSNGMKWWVFSEGDGKPWSGYFKLVKSDDQGDLAKALYHANFTVKTLERFLKNRGNGCSSRGITKWELELLRSAYDALSTPLEDRKFGLNEP